MLKHIFAEFHVGDDKIPSDPKLVSGSMKEVFLSAKVAQHNAAQETMAHLIEEGRGNASDSIKLSTEQLTESKINKKKLRYKDTVR